MSEVSMEQVSKAENATVYVVYQPPKSHSTSPSANILIAAFICAICFSYFVVYLMRWIVGVDSAVPSAGRSAGSEEQGNGEEGLDKAVVDALPVVSYAVVKNMKEGKEDRECAVCLGDFVEDDKLRLLPKCSHVFHMDCIDTWFLSHATCPLCRDPLLPHLAGPIAGGSPAIGDVSRRILDADAEARLASRHEVVLAVEDGPIGTPLHHPRSDLPLDEQALVGAASDAITEESSSETRPKISRNHSARLFLSRNSNSFRKGAVEVWERLAASIDKSPSSNKHLSSKKRRTPNLNFVAMPIRRSSSLRVPSTYSEDCYNTISESLQALGAARVGVDIGPPSSHRSLRRTESCSGIVLRQGGQNKYTSLESTNCQDGEQLTGSPWAREGEQWDTIDLDPETPNTISYFQPRIPIPRPPRERGGLVDKDKTLNDSEYKIPGVDNRTKPERWNLSSLRGPFLGRRSTSDGRAQLLASSTEDLLNANMNHNPESQQDQSSALYQWTGQWLAGKERTRLNSVSPLDSWQDLEKGVGLQRNIPSS